MKLKAIRSFFFTSSVAVNVLFGWAQAQTTDMSTLSAYMERIAGYTESIRDYITVYGTGKSTVAMEPLAVGGSSVSASQAGDGYGQDAAGQFYTVSAATACSNRTESAAYKLCVAARNTLAASLQDVARQLNVLEQRQAQVNSLMTQMYNSPGELQQLQYQLSGVQTQMLNDLTRMQLSLSAHQLKRDVYQKQLVELQQSRFNGNGIGAGFQIK